ncbi:MAG: hypothetical protein HRT89_25385 [Lentisphaeria bacterium]|nr:hypothetical protein [Lentisphaeria bacterium]
MGTAVSAPLRAFITEGMCALRIVASCEDFEWLYRCPEGLNCNEGTFKSYDCPVLDWQGPNENGQVWHEWETNDADFAILNSKDGDMTIIQGISYRVIVNHVKNGLEIKMTIMNKTNQTFHNVMGVPCLSARSEQFTDTDMERTYVETASGLTLLKDTDRGTGEKCRTHYHVEGEATNQHPGEWYWGERSQTTLVSGAILRESLDGQYTIATSWQRVLQVKDNQDEHACIHSDFCFGDLEPFETKSVKGRILFIRGDAAAALKELKESL